MLGSKAGGYMTGGYLLVDGGRAMVCIPASSLDTNRMLILAKERIHQRWNPHARGHLRVVNSHVPKTTTATTQPEL